MIRIFLILSEFCHFKESLGDDVKCFLLCRHAPLNISECCQIETLLRNARVTPAPHIQGKNMSKHLDKI